ncbi:MAG: hypothetical protein ACI9WU_001330 [Myxococcota bacterium]|jgi:hypothetical protein
MYDKSYVHELTETAHHALRVYSCAPQTYEVRGHGLR